MKKKQVIWMVVFMLATTMVLAACGGNGEDSNDTGETETGAAGNSDNNASSASNQDAEPKEPVTIEIWGKQGGQGEALTKAVEAFNAKHESIQIKLTLQSANDYQETLPLAFQSKQAPDIVEAPDSDKLYQAGWLLPLDDIVSPDLMNRMQQFLKKGDTLFEGKAYAFPTNLVTSRLAYNRDLFEQAGLDPDAPPKTFSEVKQYAQKITEATQGQAYGYGLPMSWVGFEQWTVAPLALAGNENLTVRGLFNLEVNEFQPTKYAPVIELYREMIQNKWVYPGASTLDNDPMRAAFAEGKIGMYVSQSWDIGTLNQQFDTKVDWRAAPLPVEDGKELVFSVGNAGRKWAVNKDTKYPEQAGTVMEYLVGPETVLEMQKSGSLLSLLEEGKDPAYLPEDPQFKDYLPNETDRPFPVPPTGYLKLQGKTYTDVINELLLTEQPIEPALQQLEDRYNKAYQAALDKGEIKASDFTK